MWRKLLLWTDSAWDIKHDRTVGYYFPRSYGESVSRKNHTNFINSAFEN